MKPPCYRHVSIGLEYVQRLAALAEIDAHLSGGPPAFDLSSGAGVQGLVCSIVAALGERFPVHDELMVVEMLAAEPRELPGVELQTVVHFEGLHLECPWCEWPESFQLVLALTHTSENLWLLSCPPYEQEVHEWWNHRRSEFDLPPLDGLDWPAIRSRIRRLPAPWSGLWAIYRWFEGDSGYLFADVPCEYAGQWEFPQINWSVESVELLSRDYELASREIFEPASELTRLCERDRAALRTCFDLALGRVDGAIGDGESISTSEWEF